MTTDIQSLPWALQDPMTVVTGACRLSFPSLARARSFRDQDPKFSGVLIFPKDADLTALKSAVQTAKQEKWGERAPANLRFPLRDGAEKVKDDGTPMAGFGDSFYFITSSSQRKPQLLDNMNNEITDEEAITKMFYPGCYVRAILRAFTYDVSGNRGVSLGLNAVQFVGHGEVLGGAPDAKGVFKPVPMEPQGGDAGGTGNTGGGGDPLGNSGGNANDMFA